MDLSSYLESGILEQYALDLLPPSERQEVEGLVETHPVLAEELARIEDDLEKLAGKTSVASPPGGKARLLNAIRLPGGLPPLLGPESQPGDFADFFSRKELLPPEGYENVFLSPVGDHAGVKTYLGWMRKGVPPEIHADLLESFLVVEGNCEVVVEGVVNSMSPGSFISIPLHKSHFVRVTSAIPCKFILQRIAA